MNRAYLREHFTHDESTGRLYRGGLEAGRYAGPGRVYRKLKIGGKRYPYTHIMWLYHFDEYPHRIYHIDGDKDNYDLSNLTTVRELTRAEIYAEYRRTYLVPATRAVRAARAALKRNHPDTIEAKRAKDRARHYTQTPEQVAAKAARRKVTRARWSDERRAQERAYNDGYVRSEEGHARDLAHLKDRRENDPQFRLIRALRKTTRVRLANAIDGKRVRRGPFQEAFGADVAIVIEHIKAQFQPGMTLDNRGTVWEIDHMIPVSWFDSSDPRQITACNHYSNIQPLFVADNRAKKNYWADMPNGERLMVDDYNRYKASI